MNDEQYNRLRKNTRPNRGVVLNRLTPREERRGDRRRRVLDSPVAGIVRAAARKLRQRETLEAAWHRVAEPTWLDTTWIEGVEAGVVTIATHDNIVRYEIIRQRARLQRALARLVPGATRLTVIATAAGDTENRA